MAPRRWPRPSTSPIAPVLDAAVATAGDRFVSCNVLCANVGVMQFGPRQRITADREHGERVPPAAARHRRSAPQRAHLVGRRAHESAPGRVRHDQVRGHRIRRRCVGSSRTTASVSPSCSRRDDDTNDREQQTAACGTGRARRVGVARRRPRGRDRHAGLGVDTVTTPEGANRGLVRRRASWASPTSSRAGTRRSTTRRDRRACASCVTTATRRDRLLTSQFGRRRNQRVGPVQWRPRCAGRCAGRGGRSSVG